MSPALWVRRIGAALDLRRRLYAKPFYRLVFGESDGLPGLVVDRYGDALVVQITTRGMEGQRADLFAALEQVVRPRCILLRNDIPARELEGLPLDTEVVLGEVADHVELEENGARFLVSPWKGQKTGWFYDQADNRTRMLRYVAGKRILDLCAYVGAWGVQAAANGASEAVCVDLSQEALAQVEENAALNGVADKVTALRGDAFETLRRLDAEGERFDLVILDPPAFIKRRRDLDAGRQAYRRLNRLGLRLLGSDGLLVTSSCSFHMGREEFLRTVQRAATQSGRSLQLLESGQQGPDHPVHPAIPETAYLKTLFLRVLPEF